MRSWTVTMFYYASLLALNGAINKKYCGIAHLTREVCRVFLDRTDKQEDIQKESISEP